MYSQLTNKNQKNILEQNFHHFMKLQNKKKLKSYEYDRLKHKLYYEAQSQLNFSRPQCNINTIDEEDVKLSELYKIYQQRGSSVNKNKHTKNATIAINNSTIAISDEQNTTEYSKDNAADISKEKNEIVENTSLTSTADINKENNEIVENTSLTSGYLTSNASCEIIENPLESNEQQKDTEAHEDEDDDFCKIVNAVRSENENNFKNEKSGTNGSKLDLQNNDNNNENKTTVRRTSRTTKPVLYSENLSHIHFIGSPKYCSTSNGIKHSNSASSRNSSGGSRKKRKIENSINDSPIVQIPFSNLLLTPTTSRHENISYVQDNTNQQRNYIKIIPLPKSAKSNTLEINVSTSFTQSIDRPSHIICGIMEPLLRKDESFAENQETAAAVASINPEVASASVDIPVSINSRVKLKRTRKPRNPKKPILSNEHKSDLAKYIETFGDGNNTVNCNNYHNQSQQQVPYQSPQNTGVSTTTGEFGNASTTIDVSNVEWRPMSSLPNSNTIPFEILNNSNQMEVDLDNSNAFNIISYINGENILPANTVPQNNNYQISTNSTSQNVTSILKTSLPGDISSTTVDLTNQILKRSNPGDLSYDINNIFLHQSAPSAPPQPLIKNHYERATLASNFPPPQIEIGDQYQIINAPLPSAHQSSNNYSQRTQIGNAMHALDLSNNHTMIDLAARQAKEELIIQNTSGNSEKSPKKYISVEDYKKRNLNKITLRGRDMPILVEDDNGAIGIDENNKRSTFNDINLSENSTNNINLIENPNQTACNTNDIQRIIEVIDSQIVVEMPRNMKINDKNLIEVNICDQVIDEKYENNKKNVLSKDAKSVQLTNCKSNDCNSNENVDKKLLEDNEIINNDSKSNNELDGSQCIDEFLSMKDNTVLDYEQDLEDYLSINLSPCSDFDIGDDDVPNATRKSQKNDIKNNNFELTTPPKSQQLKNKTETLDIFGIIHKSLPEKVNPTEEKNTTTLTNINHCDRITKDFKIPKINNELKQNNTNCSSSTITNLIDKQTLNRTSVLNFSEEPIIPRCWPNNPTNIIKPPTMVHPRISMPSISSCGTIPLTKIPESTVSHSEIRIRHISHIFGSPCYNFLKENCTKEHCRYKHFLPDPANVKSTLLELNDQFIEKAFYETTRYHLFFFNRYFDMFLQIYCEKNNEHMLKQVINQCQVFAKSTEFLERIRNALIKFGKTKIEAVQMIIDNWQFNIQNSKNIINLIIELIIDADPLQFLSTLEYYSKFPDYRYQAESINKLVAIYNKYKNYDLMQILKNILNKLPLKEILQDNKYKNTDFMKSLEMLKNIDDLENQNNILQRNCNTQSGLPLIQRTIKVDNLTTMLNQQLQPGQQNLFLNSMQ